MLLLLFNRPDLYRRISLPTPQGSGDPTKIKLIVNCAYLFYFITPYTSPLSLVVRHGYGQTYPIQTNLFYPNYVAMPYYF